MVMVYFLEIPMYTEHQILKNNGDLYVLAGTSGGYRQQLIISCGIESTVLQQE